jgi:hypothetical protein
LAQDIALAAPQPFGIGRILASSFSIFGRNLGTFLIVAFATSVPFILIATWMDYRALHQLADSGGGSSQVLVNAVQMLTAALVQAALTYGTLADLRGERATAGACFRNGWRWGSRVFRAAFVYSILMGLAVIALVVPAFFLYVMWWVYVPAIVVEGLGVAAAFRRSRELTAGRRWRILGLSLVTLLILLAAAMIVLVPALRMAGHLWAEIGFTLIAVLYNAFLSVVTAVGYYTLRMEKEGVDIEAIAQVFG